MTRVYRRVTPADVLHVAGESPADVPQLLATMDAAELGAVRALGEQLVRYVDKVVGHRHWRKIWDDAGRQIAVDYSHHVGYAGPEMWTAGGEVWTGQEPSWPTDEPAAVPPVPPGMQEGDVPANVLTPPVLAAVLDQDPDRTQVVDADVIAAAAEQYGPLVELTARAAPPAPEQQRRPRAVPVTMDPVIAEELAALAVEGSADGGTSDGTAILEPVRLGEHTGQWNPGVDGWGDDGDWSALPHDDDTLADNRRGGSA